MLRKHLKKVHKGQGGFTLIEVLVVMTILGILAAIVSISLLGVTANARIKARDAEKATVQAALDAMLSDQQVPGPPDPAIASACSASGTTNNMAAFPGTTLYTTPDTGAPVVLATHYLRQANTQYKYSCDGNGLISQSGP